jgi:integrase
MEYQGKRKGKKLSYKTVKNIHGCLSSALETAVKIRYIKENPAAGCTIPRDDEDSRTTLVKPLDTAQIIQFTSAIEGSKYERIYLTALYTGMRLSEIIGLQWDRVNLQTGEIIISKQLTMKREKGSARRMVSTKSRKIRSIIIPQTAIDVLTEQKKAQAQQQLQAGSQWENDLNLVFTGDYGSSVPHASVEHDFKRIVRGMELPDRRFHDLRHTFATEAIRAGVDVETVSKALGHFSVGFTLDVYGHVTQEMKVEAARRIQQAIDNRKNA